MPGRALSATAARPATAAGVTAKTDDGTGNAVLRAPIGSSVTGVMVTHAVLSWFRRIFSEVWALGGYQTITLPISASSF
jgi:hypothetical protein